VQWDVRFHSTGAEGPARNSEGMAIPNKRLDELCVLEPGKLDGKEKHPVLNSRNGGYYNARFGDRGHLALTTGGHCRAPYGITRPFKRGGNESVLLAMEENGELEKAVTAVEEGLQRALPKGIRLGSGIKRTAGSSPMLRAKIEQGNAKTMVVDEQGAPREPSFIGKHSLVRATLIITGLYERDGIAWVPWKIVHAEVKEHGGDDEDGLPDPRSLPCLI